MPLTPQKRAAVDRKIEETIGRLKIRIPLDRRHSEGKTWAPYERYLLSNDHTIFVNLAADPVTVTMSEEPANAKTIKNVEQLEKRREERAARKAEREAKKAKRAAKPKAEKKPKAERKAKPAAAPKVRKSKFGPEREKRIAEIITEKGCSRKNAIRHMWNEEAVKEADAKATPEKKVVDPLAQATPVTE